MSAFSEGFVLGLVAFIIGGIFGWAVAHNEVAIECKRQGSFYVGKEDFECKVKQ